MTASGTPILEVITYLQYLAQTIVSMSQQSECTQQNIVEHQLVKSWLWDFLSGLRAPCSDSQCSSQWKSQPENICSNMVSECAHVTWSTSISVISHSDLHFHDQAISCWGSDILGWGPLPKRKMWSAVTQKLSKDLAHQPRGGASTGDLKPLTNGPMVLKCYWMTFAPAAFSARSLTYLSSTAWSRT